MKQWVKIPIGINRGHLYLEVDSENMGDPNKRTIQDVTASRVGNEQFAELSRQIEAGEVEVVDFEGSDYQAYLVAQQEAQE